MAADTMTYDPLEPFAGPGTNSPPPSDRWMPILPAPHPLPASIRHGRYGTPSEVWQYLDPGGSLLYALCICGGSRPSLGAPVRRLPLRPVRIEEGDSPLLVR